MEIPKKVKIGAHEYEIVNDDDIADSDARFGHCVPRKLKIYIDSRVKQSQQEETFFHEVLHAICDQVRALEKDDTDYLQKLVGLLQERIEMDRIIQEFLDKNPPKN